MSGSLHEIPFALKSVGFVAGVLGIVLFLWLGWHALRRVLDSPRVPLSGATYFVLGVLCLALLVVAAVPLGVAQVLRQHARVNGDRTQVGEVRCTKAGAGKVRITFVRAGGGDSPPEQVESTGPSCRLSAEVVTLRGLPARLGLGTLVRITRMGEAARPSDVPAWLLPAPDVPPPFPFALLVRGSRLTALQATPDERAVYQLVATPAGVALERAGG